MMRVTSKRITVISLTAAVYTVMTLAIPMLSYGVIQCRLSEILNLLAFINPVFAPGIVLGCFISNLFSPNGLLDCIVGTIATVFAMVFITNFSKNLFVASLWPTIFCVFIGAEILYISKLPLTIINLAMPTVAIMAGEFIAMTIGYFVFKQIMKNKNLVEMLKAI